MINHDSFATSLSKLEISSPTQKIVGLIGLMLRVLVALASFWISYSAQNSAPQDKQEDSQRLISELKKELTFLRNELEQNHDDLFTAIEEIEVSIHLLNNKMPENKASNKPKPLPHEAKLNRWRFLGSSKIGDSHQGFFSTAKGNVAFEKGAHVLGEWRLSNIENGLASLSHPQGKILILKASPTE